MDLVDGSYLALAGLAGGAARALRRGLPEGWRLRLEARPARELPPGKWIWIHAVSVGELLLADGLVQALRDEGHRLHLTTGTVGGLDLLQRRLGVWDAGTGRVSGGAFPFDDPAGLRPFLASSPGLFLALETELWPNLLRELSVRGVPCVVVNGRLTARSLERGGAWMRRSAARLALVAARDPQSAEAFRALGAKEVEVAGNLKADLPPPAELHPHWSPLVEAWAGDPVLVVGNTVEGEETLVLNLFEGLRQAYPSLRLILAPRQPRRFDDVATLLAGRDVLRASEAWPSTRDEAAARDILLLDTLGELPRAWSLGTLAIVGGGWRWQGGHNPLEALRFGVPTFIGPGYDNFRDVVEALRGSTFLKVVAEADLAREAAQALASAPRRGDGQPDPALAPLMGATGRTLDLLRKVLPSPPTAP
jgi:3-deoxy-D-manno-octulosonic-acid transferase